MNKKIAEKIISSLFILFAFIACSNSLDDDGRNEEDGKCSVCVNTGFPVRSAFPSDLSDDTVYGLVISYASSSGKTKYLTQTSVSDSLGFISVETSDTSGIRFVFCTPTEDAKYTLTLYAFPSGTEDLNTAKKADAFACGSSDPISLSAGQTSYSQNITIKLYIIEESSGKGSVSLNVLLDSVPTIKSCNLIVTKGDVGDSTGNNYGFMAISIFTTLSINANDIPSGAYRLVMKFYDENNQEIEVNSSVHEICVYSGLVTDTWYISGKKLGKTLSLERYDFSELYVKGENATSGTDGKLSFYTTEIHKAGVPTASDSTGTGAMSYPFETLNAALKKIKTNSAEGAATKDFTIYVDGTVLHNEIKTVTIDSSTHSCLVDSCVETETNARNIKITTVPLSTCKAVITKGSAVTVPSDTTLYGIAIDEYAKLTIENISIPDGLISYADENHKLYMKDCDVGETLCVMGSSATFENVTFDKVIVKGKDVTFTNCTINGAVTVCSDGVTFNNCLLKNGATVDGTDDITVTLTNSVLCSETSDKLALSFTKGNVTLQDTILMGGISCGEGSSSSSSESNCVLNLNGTTHGKAWNSMESYTAANITSVSSFDNAVIPISMYSGSIQNTNLTTDRKLFSVSLYQSNFNIGRNLIKVTGSANWYYFTSHYDVSYMPAIDGTTWPALCLMPITNDSAEGFTYGAIQYAGVVTNATYSGNPAYKIAFAYFNSSTSEKVLPGVLTEGSLQNVAVKLSITNTDGTALESSVSQELKSVTIYQNNSNVASLTLSSSDGEKYASLPTWLPAGDYKIMASVQVAGLSCNTETSLYIQNKQKGFVKIPGVTISGTESWTPTSSIFITERSLTINPFYMCDHEVTQDEFETVMGALPQAYTTAANANYTMSQTDGNAGNNPVNMVNWYHAVVYCNKLSINEGLDPCYSAENITNLSDYEYSRVPTTTDEKWNAIKCDLTKNGYRLPTEAEWEWAARGGGEGTIYAGSNTIGDVAWYESNAESKTHEVKQKQANAYGLYDMSGNVWEWCYDWYNTTISKNTPATGATTSSSSPVQRVLRGGGLSHEPANASVSNRGSSTPFFCGKDRGFRVVRNVN